MRSIANPETGAKSSRKPRYVALIADVVASRQLEGAARRKLQERIETTLAGINRRFAEAIVAKFVITIGDEFQGLLEAAGVIPELLRALERELSEVQLRVGIGCGTLDTDLRKTAVGMDGPVWHRARHAIETAKATRRLGGIYNGFPGQDDLILNSLSRLMHHQRSALTAKQRLILDALLAGHSHQEIADSLGIRRQAVTKQAAAAGFEAYREGEIALRAILERD